MLRSLQYIVQVVVFLIVPSSRLPSLVIRARSRRRLSDAPLSSRVVHLESYWCERSLNISKKPVVPGQERDCSIAGITMTGRISVQSRVTSWNLMSNLEHPGQLYEVLDAAREAVCRIAGLAVLFAFL